MKWGSGKKNKPLPSPSSSSSSTSRPSLISHVFPSTWLSKFKQKSGDSELKLKPSYVKRKGKRNSPSFGSPRRTSGRFYGDDDGDDGFWRLSFGEDSAEGEKKTRDNLRSAPFDSDDEFAGSTTRKMEEGREEWKMKKWLELEREAGELEEERSTKRGEDGVLEMLAARTIGTKVKDNKHGLTASGARKHHFVSSLNSRNSTLNTIEEEASNLETEEVAEGKKTPDWKKLKERKIEGVTAKSEKHRESVYVSRELQRRRPKRSNKVRVCSPRTASRVEICKIKALEDMAKAKMKTKKAYKGRKVQQVRTSLDSFAVVKCSFDPQQDFRDSMVEMIVEKKLTGPDDLEELLACYLTLNSDEYHDLIIKVFRQVWFELNQACFGSELQNQHCCND